ncbi:MAG: hypothetical protein ABW152_09325 [Candidatus Thiodiazotropha endolucinida]
MHQNDMTVSVARVHPEDVGSSDIAAQTDEDILIDASDGIMGTTLNNYFKIDVEYIPIRVLIIDYKAVEQTMRQV